jgi:hypothetical protein
MDRQELMIADFTRVEGLLWVGVSTFITAVMTGLFVDQLGSITGDIINLIVFVSASTIAILHSFSYLNRL